MEYDSLIQLVSVGLGFINDCQNVLSTSFPTWKDKSGLRVGIAFGQVTGAMLGNKISRFDAFGAVPIEAERAQSGTGRNTVGLSQSALKILRDNKPAITEYVLDYITAEQLRNRVVKVSDELLEFKFVKNGQLTCIQGFGPIEETNDYQT